MPLFHGIQEYIALDANNIARVSISGNIFLYPPQVHPILYNYLPICLVAIFCSHIRPLGAAGALAVDICICFHDIES